MSATAQNLITRDPIDVGATLRHARLQRGLSLRELAARAGTSHATLSAYEKSRKIPTTHTFLRILAACDYGVDLVLNRRIRQRHGMSRAEELVEVLNLAEQFPSKPAGTLQFPRFRIQQ
jgi:predicted transcriptional regulator